MNTGKYRLAPDVFACVSGGCLVFLDLRRDQYACLDRNDTAAALALLDDRQLKSADWQYRHEPLQLRNSMTIVQTLAHRGLLQQSGTEADIPVPKYFKPTGSFLDSVSKIGSQLPDTRYCLAFLRASLAASARLRWSPIYKTVRRFGRSARAPGRAKACRQRLTELVEVFVRLRPYYPRPYLCLFDSLALLQFLSGFGLRADWVFGVRTEPFNAHCWIQVGDYVLNDTVEEVSDYTPIMIV